MSDNDSNDSNDSSHSSKHTSTDSSSDTNNSPNTANKQITKEITPKVIKRGLLIGINYFGTNAELNGCINDVNNLQKFLTAKQYFNDDDFVKMTDDRDKKDDLCPTKKNILRELNNLVDFSNSHKDEQVQLFLSYSGHGYHIRDRNGDEADGQDEVLCPVDYNTHGFIVDDYLKNNFIDKLGSNVTIVVIIDACHSGTALDLKFNYRCGPKNKCFINKKVRVTKCKVAMISGCRDNQTSADASFWDFSKLKWNYQGAMTASFIANYHDGVSYLILIRRMRFWLRKKKFEQIPQLATGNRINTRQQFLLSSYDD